MRTTLLTLEVIKIIYIIINNPTSLGWALDLLEQEVTHLDRQAYLGLDIGTPEEMTSKSKGKNHTKFKDSPLSFSHIERHLIMCKCHLKLALGVMGTPNHQQ